ncbi:30S ribosomal protein S6 [Mycoplasma nasistruthionis]|uniref:Small ribosomal subunit protein bS6 n=1 Tax=Mycoplasma nasistruthionis TaxID=353852 RepID=A0A4Y6I5L1_9MOLU|nr:30S ribosomal protein S6 [Mycoplasma nasistruthionis]QDF64904.1 30S ribosomal protein S6 [Mycoplasma nasistruthionis]
MHKYEIMAIVNPKADVAVYTSIVEEVFGKENVSKLEKLEKNELAYEINKSKHAQYVLALVEAKGESMAEFTRRTNIVKDIWRTLVINLDSEKGLKPKKESKVRKFASKRALNGNEAQTDKPFKRQVKVQETAAN